MNIEAFNDNSEIGAPFIMEGFEDCEGKTGSDCSAMTCNWNDTQGKCLLTCHCCPCCLLAVQQKNDLIFSKLDVLQCRINPLRSA